MDKAFKPPNKRQAAISTPIKDNKKPCHTLKESVLPEVDTPVDDIHARLGLVISRLDVMQECLDVLAAWCIPEESPVVMEEDKSKQS